MVTIENKDNDGYSTTTPATKPTKKKKKLTNMPKATKDIDLPKSKYIIETEKEKIDPKSTVNIYKWGIVGLQKCGTTFLYNFFGEHEQIPLLSKEFNELHRPGVENLEQFFERVDVNKQTNKKGKPLLKGFSVPEALTSTVALSRMETFLPETRMIYTTRHPIKWIESFYNYRYRPFKYPDIKPLEELIGNCGYDCGDNGSGDECVTSDGYWMICTETAKVHVHLSRLGWTPMSTTEEQSLLETSNANYSIHNFPHTQLFLIEEHQMRDDNKSRVEQFQDDMAKFIGVENGPLKFQSDERKNTNPRHKVNICNSKYDELRKVLLDIGAKSSEWIREYFVKSPQVVVSSEEYFLELIDEWKYDPCLK